MDYWDNLNLAMQLAPQMHGCFVGWAIKARPNLQGMGGRVSSVLLNHRGPQASLRKMARWELKVLVRGTLWLRVQGCCGDSEITCFWQHHLYQPSSDQDQE